MEMLKRTIRRLFPYRDVARRLEAIETSIVRYQRSIDYLVSVLPIQSSDPKELAYFLHLNKSDAKGQLFQDLWVLWETRGKTGGYFVEFGATDGKFLSNTLLLEEKYQWTGILAEPMPSWHAQLRQRKAIIETRCVWTKSKEKLSFLCTDDPELSGIKSTGDRDFHADERKSAQQIEVDTISLNDLLKEHQAPKVIDYLSIDTEGSEYDILSHFDFGEYRFNLITVEHNYTGQRERIHALLDQKGYHRVFEEFSQFDDWYVHRSFRQPDSAK